MSCTPLILFLLTGDFVVVIAAGDGHTCAMMAGGGVKCWGLNNYGQLGIGSKTNQNLPVDVPGEQGLEWPCPDTTAIAIPPHPSPTHAFQTEESLSTFCLGLPPASYCENAGEAEGRLAARGSRGGLVQGWR
jgi:hypothetical protein